MANAQDLTLQATLFTAFGALALIVALIGIYSTVSYIVGQRTHEFGVEATDPSAMMLAACTLIGVALIAGLIPAWRAARVDPVSSLKAE